MNLGVVQYLCSTCGNHLVLAEDEHQENDSLFEVLL